MKRTLIFGTGAFGHYVYNGIKDKGQVIGFLDNDASKWGTQIEGVPVLGNADALRAIDYDEVVVCSHSGRLEINDQLRNAGVAWAKVNNDFFDPWKFALLGFTPEIQKLCERNIKFKDSAGGRCFVLGNGPSLLDVDFSLLTDDFVFTVNLLNKIPGYKKLKTNAHVIVDPVFYDAGDAGRYSKQDLMSLYHAISEESALCFFACEAHDFIVRNGLNNILDAYYFHRPIRIHQSKEIFYDLCRPTSGFPSVVQDTIKVAVYMGFKEIYLLGCDATYFSMRMSAAEGKPLKNIHAYNDHDENELFSARFKKEGMTRSAFAIFESFLAWDCLNIFCRKKGIKICNCSSKTLIDSIPRMDLAAVLG